MKGKKQEPMAKQDESQKDMDMGDGKDKEKEEGAEKSMTAVNQDDLEKSIAKLEEFTQTGDQVSRKEALLAKAQSGDLSAEERDELFKALGGQTEEAPKAEPISKGLQGNETLQKALDVSDYLSEQHSELCKSLDLVGEVIEKSDKRQHEFNLVLAKTVVDTGNLVKSIAEKLNIIASQPARAPKSLGAQPMEKSFAGTPPSDMQLNQTQILDGMDMLMEKSMSTGQNGLTEDGEDILKSISKYEQTHQITRSMLERVKGVIAERAAAAH